MVLVLFSRMHRLCPVRQAPTASKGSPGLFSSSAEPVSRLLNRLVVHPPDPGFLNAKILLGSSLDGLLTRVVCSSNR